VSFTGGGSHEVGAVRGRRRSQLEGNRVVHGGVGVCDGEKSIRGKKQQSSEIAAKTVHSGCLQLFMKFKIIIII